MCMVFQHFQEDQHSDSESDSQQTQVQHLHLSHVQDVLMIHQSVHTAHHHSSQDYHRNQHHHNQWLAPLQP